MKRLIELDDVDATLIQIALLGLVKPAKLPDDARLTFELEWQLARKKAASEPERIDRILIMLTNIFEDASNEQHARSSDEPTGE